MLEIGDEIGYHGRIGIVNSIDGGYAIVYFSDIDDETEISLEELEEQGN